MSYNHPRSLAILVCLLCLIACVNACPNASDGLDDMDFSWISDIGSQFSDLVAHDHFAQMATTPMTRSFRGPQCPQPQLQQQPQSQSQPQPQSRAQPSPPQLLQESNGSGDFSTWSMEFTRAMESQCTATCSQSAPSYPALHHAPQTLGLSNHGLETGLDGTELSWPMLHRHSVPETSIQAQQQHGMGVQSQTYPPPMALPAQSGLGNGYAHPAGDVHQGWPIIPPQQQHLSRLAVDQFNLHAYSMAPIQAPQPVPANFAMTGNQYEHPMSRSVPNIPHILSPDVTNNFNYQPGMQSSTVGNMLGWIGRAPTTGDRAVPRIDTNCLAPPDAQSVNHSPSTACTTPSSARPGSSRRKPWQMTSGDFICFYCKAGFPTQGDLTHHLRSHQPYMSRQHVCTTCEKRFQYRKDLMRHVPKHDPNRKKYYCPYSGCKYHSKGFGRQDHLDRHLGSQHPQHHHRIDTPQQISRPPSSAFPTNVTNDMTGYDLNEPY